MSQDLLSGLLSGMGMLGASMGAINQVMQLRGSSHMHAGLEVPVGARALGAQSDWCRQSDTRSTNVVGGTGLTEGCKYLEMQNEGILVQLTCACSTGGPNCVVRLRAPGTDTRLSSSMSGHAEVMTKPCKRKFMRTELLR